MGNGSRKIILIGIIVIIIAFVMTMAGRGTADSSLPSYSSENRVEVVENNSNEGQDIETFIYTDDENSFSLSIPSGWTQVNQGDYTSFIHQPTGTAVQIQVLDYDPSVNNMTADTMSLSVAQNGYTYVNFNKVSSSQYEVIYQDYGTSTYDYLEEVYWDREKVIKLVFVTEDTYYDSMLPYFQEIFGSFVWQKVDPIPDGYSLYYSEAGDMELCVPDGWALGASSDALVCYDESTGAQFTVTLESYAGDLSSMTAVDVSSAIRGTKSNFIMQQYIPGTDQLCAITTYMVDGTQYQGYVYMYCNGQYLCTVSYDYPAGVFDDSVVTTSASYFRFLSSYFASEEATEAGSGLSEAEEGNIAQDDISYEQAAPDNTAPDTTVTSVLEQPQDNSPNHTDGSVDNSSME